MGQIPADAAHWDSGDWIEWHRAIAEHTADDDAATPSDPAAVLTALQVNMLRSARAWWEATKTHLPVYHEIARVHAALNYDMPVSQSPCDAERPVMIRVIAPFSATNTVEVDLDKPFSAVLIVRIRDNWTVAGRMLRREQLKVPETGPLVLSWAALTTAR